MTFKFLDTEIIIDNSWDKIFLNNEELIKIEQILACQKKITTPEIDLIFKVFSKPVKNIKYIILGQDPYPQKGIATGRAFEINKNDWDKGVNQSLIKILKSLYYYQTKKIETIENIRKDNQFKILPPNKLFKNWEKNGVFLLNTSLTCVIGEPNSHEWLWRNFTDEVIRYIYEYKREKKWLLWRKYACDKLSNLNFNGNSCNKIHEAIHPANSGEKFITGSGLDLLKFEY